MPAEKPLKQISQNNCNYFPSPDNKIELIRAGPDKVEEGQAGRQALNFQTRSNNYIQLVSETLLHKSKSIRRDGAEDM